MWQSIGVLQLRPPNPKWSVRYKRPNPFNLQKIHRRSSKVTATGAEGKCETDGPRRRIPSLPNTVRLSLAAFAAAQRPDGSFRYQLFSFGDLQAAASPWPDAMGVRSADIIMDASSGLWARVFSPSSVNSAAAPLPVIVYFHGGGFVLFSAASCLYDAFCRQLSRELRAVVVSVNYRRAPQHRFPAAYDDGVAALCYLDANNALPVPVDVSSCFLAGDSAGGNIAHHVAQRWSSSSIPPGNLRVAGAVLIQPLFGGEERTRAELELGNACASLTLASADYYWRVFLPEGATRDHAAARVSGREVGSSFPPAMVVVGGFDPLKDRHARYVEELRQGKQQVRMVEYPDAIHGFYLFPEIPDSARLMADVKLFVDEHKTDTAV